MKKKPNDFDGEACIKLLLDKSLDSGIREDAADILMWHPQPNTCKAMLNVILDESEDSELRMEVASCLGSLWAELGFDDKELLTIPERYRCEIKREIQLIKTTEPAGGPYRAKRSEDNLQRK